MSSSSHVLLLGANSVEALVPSTLISQIESLLDRHRLEDAFNVADARRKKLEESLEVDEDETEELHYIYQRIGFQYFTETLFEDAGNNFFNGHLDPRVLVSYYPHLRGNLFGEEDNVDLYAGVADHMPKEASVDDIVISNLVRNYSPHLSPNTLSAPSTAELRRILQERSIEMLEKFLKKERRRRIALNLDEEEGQKPQSSLSNGKGKGKQGPHSIREIIDTILAKLYAQLEKTSDMYDLLLSSNFVVLSEVEDVFKATGQYNALCILYQKGGDIYDERLLDIWSKVVEGEWLDPDIPDPLLQMISLLTSKRDKPLTQKWAIWLTKRDPDAGIRLITSLREVQTSGKRRNRDRATVEDDLDMLQQLSEASPDASKQYLEYLIIQKRTNSRELHNRFALSAIEEILRILSQDEATAKLWKAKTSSYAASSTSKSQKAPQIPSGNSSFMTHFAATTPDSPSKRLRLKAILFLSGSQLYNPLPLKEKIEQADHGNLLALETAILEGKLGNHKSALTILACKLKDALSAEAYCSLGGEVIPRKVAISIAEGGGLGEWADVLYPTQSTRLATKPPSAQDSFANLRDPQLLNPSKSVDELKKSQLLNQLLEVYLGDTSAVSTERAALLINSQAMHLDVLSVIALVPRSWPLPLLSSFLARSLRRITNETREGKITKNISSGQNLEVKETTYEPVREAGALLEEELEIDGGEYDEKKHPGVKPQQVVDIIPEGSLLFNEKAGAAVSKHDDEDLG